MSGRLSAVVLAAAAGCLMSLSPSLGYEKTGLGYEIRSPVQIAREVSESELVLSSQ